MNTALATKALNYVAVSSALTKKALDEVGVHRAAQEKAAAARQPLVEYMLKVGAANESQKATVEAMLGSHAETLGLLKSAIDKIVTLQEALKKRGMDLGEGEDDKGAGEKTAGDYDSLNDCYVGRKTGKRKASDAAILSVLNGPGS